MTRSALRWTIPTFLALQLGLIWIQGAQLQRQNQVLQGLREDIQALAESIEASQSSDADGDDSASAPARFHVRSTHPRLAALVSGEDQDPAAKDLQAARESAQNAVKEAREAQSKLSIEENMRKAEETKKIESAQNQWRKWVYGALALVALAFLGRSVLRRRG